MKATPAKFQLIDVPDNDSSGAFLFPDNIDLQDAYDKASSVLAELKNAESSGKPEWSSRTYKRQYREMLNEVPISVDVLAIIEGKDKELVDRIIILNNDIEQYNEEIEELNQLIDDMQVEHVAKIVRVECQDIENIETQIEKWSGNIKRLERQKIANQKAIDVIKGMRKITRDMVFHMNKALLRRELEEAEKTYKEHLAQFAEYFKEFNVIAMKVDPLNFKYKQDAVLGNISSLIYPRP